MNNEIPILIFGPLLAAAAVVVFLLGVTAYKRALNISRHNAALLFLFCIAASAASMFYRESLPMEHPREGYAGGPKPFWIYLVAGLLPFFVVPFLIKLYQR